VKRFVVAGIATLTLGGLVATEAEAHVLSSDTALAASAKSAGFRDRDCADFRNRRHAQRFFRKHRPRRDPHGLDADNDGRECEHLPCPCKVRVTLVGGGASAPGTRPGNPPAGPPEAPVESVRKALAARL
jgi:hypothetical protein